MEKGYSSFIVFCALLLCHGFIQDSSSRFIFLNVYINMYTVYLIFIWLIPFRFFEEGTLCRQLEWIFPWSSKSNITHGEWWHAWCCFTCIFECLRKVISTPQKWSKVQNVIMSKCLRAYKRYSMIKFGLREASQNMKYEVAGSFFKAGFCKKYLLIFWCPLLFWTKTELKLGND